MNKGRVLQLYMRLRRIIAILQTPYRGLILDDLLNFRANGFSVPPMQVLYQDNDWNLFDVGGMHFFWPREYDDSSLRSLYRETFAPKQCNPHSFEAGSVTIKPGTWVVDAGACEGFFTHLALSRGANVLAIEPVAKLAEALTYTFKREIQQGRVIVLQGVIGATEGKVELMIPKAGVIAATTDLNWEINSSWQRVKPQKVNDNKEIVTQYTIDGLANGGLVPRLDFIKMDIENAEITALEGMKQTLYSQIPKLSIAVYHDYMNGTIIRSRILNVQPLYRVRWRGIFIRESYGPPRPYMLYASV